MKGLKKHILDFEILETNNPYNLIFLDSSSYYTDPTTPILQLVEPGTNDEIIVNISSGKANVFNSHTLGKTNALNGDSITKIKDGVWQATYRICPYNDLYKVKYFVRFEQINECLYKIYKDFDTECCTQNNESLKKQLNDIYLLMESAKANAYNNLKQKAEKDYALAVKKIKKLSDGLWL